MNEIWEATKVILVIAVLIIPCWIVLASVVRWLLGLDKADKAEEAESRLWNKNAARSVERLNALYKAQQTGNYDYYSALARAHKADFDADVRELVASGRLADELPQAKPSPAPSGRTARAKR